MNREINEVLSAKAHGKPELVSAQARELLNLRRLPAMLNVQQTAVLLGLADHDIPVLVNVGLLKPLGDPSPNAVKYFASVHILELAGELSHLCKIRNTVYAHWRAKNVAKSKPQQFHNCRA
jgi:hypothetical protein